MRKTLLALMALFIIAAPVTQLSAAYVTPAVTLSTEPDAATVKAATDAFKNLSKKEKREKAREAKKAINEYKANKKAGKDAETNTLLLVILAILLPPLAVYLHQGEINSKFWISLLLTLLFWLPGVIYALILILGNK